MRRITACVVACLIVIGLVARTASAQRAPANSEVSTASGLGFPRELPASGGGSDRVAAIPPLAEFRSAGPKPNEKVKADVAKLVAETKAGKRSVIPSTQFPPPHRNNLSKGAKIGIIVGVALVVIAIIVWKSFEYDCESRCVL